MIETWIYDKFLLGCARFDGNKSLEIFYKTWKNPLCCAKMKVGETFPESNNALCSWCHLSWSIDPVAKRDDDNFGCLKSNDDL